MTEQEAKNAKPVQTNERLSPRWFDENGKIKRLNPNKVVAIDPQPKTEKQKQAEANYWEQVNNPKPPQAPSAEDFKRLFHQVMKLKGFEVLDYQKPLIECFGHYVTGNEKEFKKLAYELNCQTEPSLKKGMLLVGSVGIGKTEFMHSINEACRNQGFVNPIIGQIHSTTSIAVQSRDKNSAEQAFRNMTKGNRIFEDIGREKTIKVYSYSGLEVMYPIYLERYMKKLKTHGTSNFTHGELGMLYDKDEEHKLVFERFYEMFNIFEVDGENLRR